VVEPLLDSVITLIKVDVYTAVLTAMVIVTVLAVLTVLALLSNGALSKGQEILLQVV
jgi:hypothetical protein